MIKIGGGNQETFRTYPVDKYQNAINDSAEFAMLVNIIARARQSIEFIKKKYTGLLSSKLKDLAYVGGCFSKI
ncbi:hypothetical protein BLTE_20900 [Blastochloris tepida]|uniref:Uncharacterized protein n=1 Tax=Blastochloris tepida TaxID=2233851 RepID=A0A348G1H2_9HYPH|nr:hypothetical protein BLTE_20900 [Blastochloris tepida]